MVRANLATLAKHLRGRVTVLLARSLIANGQNSHLPFPYARTADNLPSMQSTSIGIAEAHFALWGQWTSASPQIWYSAASIVIQRSIDTPNRR